MSATCGRVDCGLQPGDRFCMMCGKAATDVSQASVVPPAVIVEQARPISADLSDFATGTTEQNAVYLGNRLMYTRGVEEMDPVRNPRVLGHLIAQMILFVSAPLIVSGALIFVATLSWVVNVVVSNPLTSLLTPVAAVLSGLAMLTTAVCWIVAWFRRVPVRNAEWIMYLDDKGSVAPAVFAHVTTAFERRATPAETVRVKRVALPGGKQRDMLEVRYGVFTGYVTAYEFGNDLHIGWVYFWQLSIVRYVLLAISNLLNGLRGRQTEVHVLARYEPAKTMREALHAAAREGVDVAGSASLRLTGSAMPANVPVDSVAAMPLDGSGLFAS